ncbi:serine/threonine kinase [Caballeronia sordidicola]|uniref:Serine/threonine kinase n=1 Tax=Caballeronia sordidicola TaxID=196367 RepID=A0A158GCF5_CABSO|nr:SUMF1/EgtB/PvdO family nonheme iron enzyme [Caballeronia sordidicola]SAL29521.1 serine/threonine kinase [Caballeronia sordidicola]
MGYPSYRACGTSRAFAVLSTSLLLSCSAFAQKIDVNAPADKDRLIREITTPSPHKSTWEHLSMVLKWGRGKPYDDTVGIIQDYFKTLPPPGSDELAKFRQKLQGELVFVSGGEFLMGDFGPHKSPEKLPYSANEGAAPAHAVTLDSYSILKHRVTYADYDLYTRANKLPPAAISKAEYLEFRFPDYPVAYVTWRQSRDFCSWLGQVTSMKFDLPTEAQWEYAARSRGELWVIPSTAVPVVDGKYNLEQLDGIIDKMEGNGTSPEPLISRPVGTYGDNKIGVSDVFGRGREWTRDWFDKTYYSHSAAHDPRGPEAGGLRTVRFATSSRTRLVIDRAGLAPDTEKSDLGFRCVLNQTEPAGR